MSSRRDFLRRTAGAAAAASVSPAFAAAEEWLDDGGPVPQAAKRAQLGADEMIRIGVIGTGGMGAAHAEALTRLAAAGRTKVRVDALCDVHPVGTKAHADWITAPAA